MPSFRAVRTLPWAVPLALAAVLLLAACGGDGEGGTTPSADETPPAAGGLQPQPTPAQGLETTRTEPQGGVLNLTAADIAFSPNHLGMTQGQTVAIRLTNDDSVPHNLRIAGPDGEYETEDDTVTEPDLLNSGDTGELSFAPQIVGAYTFRCDFHPTQMGGQVVVE